VQGPLVDGIVVIVMKKQNYAALLHYCYVYAGKGAGVACKYANMQMCRCADGLECTDDNIIIC